MLSVLIGSSACAVVAGSAYLSPHSLRYLQSQALARRAARTRSLVLTYDDGPGKNTTPQVAAMLSEAEAKATFFLLGTRAHQHPEIIDMLVSDGHELACHTYNHTNAWKVTPWNALADINRGYAALSRWVAKDGVFRPPYGKVTLATWISLRRRNARVAWWTIDSGDTHRDLPRPQEVVDKVERAQGGVVLMHDFDRDEVSGLRSAFVLETTELLLKTARREGFRICRFKDLRRE